MSGRRLLSAVSRVCGVGQLLNFPEDMQTFANLTFILAWGLKCCMSKQWLAPGSHRHGTGRRGWPFRKPALKPRAPEAIFCLLLFSYTLQPVHLRIYRNWNYTEVERDFKVKSRPNEVQQSMRWTLTKWVWSVHFFVCIWISSWL